MFTCSTLKDIGVGKDFLYRVPFTQELRPTIDKLVFIEHRGQNVSTDLNNIVA